MRTQAPLAITLALFISVAFFAGSGFNATITGDRGTGQLQEQVNDSANAEAGDDIQAQRGSDESSIVGLIIGASQDLSRILGMMALLPITLQNLGFPQWFALPIGTVVELLLLIATIQFVTGRVVR